MGRSRNKKNKKKAGVMPGESIGISHDNGEKTLAEADAAAGALIATAKTTTMADETKEDETEIPTKKPNVNSKRARDVLNENKADDKDDEPAQPKLTRKQKRQKLNEKNKWPQLPKVANPEARERAYLRVAGIEKARDDEDDKDNEEAPEVKINMESDDNDAEWRRFGRFLGAADARTRHKAVKRLEHYLKAKSGHGAADPSEAAGLSELDLLKIWKGLWFTLYMADKVPVQDELAKHIAKLMWCLVGPPIEDDMAGQAYLDMEMEDQLALEQAALEEDDEEEEGSEENGSEEEDDSDAHNAEGIMDDDDDVEEDMEHEEMEDDFDHENHKHIRGAPLAQLMIRTFFRTLVREWGKMDKYRVDKFYTMLRYILHEVYKYMAKRQWNLGIIKLFNDAIAEEALIKRPNGVRYHLVDIALEELVGVVKSKKKNSYLPLTEAIFLEVMEPFFAMAQHGFGDRTVQERVVEKVLEKFLNEYSLVSDIAAAGNTDKILDQVHVGTVSNFIFEMASDEGTVDTYRKSLYDVHKSYERQRKKTGTDLELNFDKQLGEGPSGDGDDEAEDADYSEEEDLNAYEDEDLKNLGFVNEDAIEEKEAPSKSAPPEGEGKKAKKNKKKAKKDKNHHDSNEGEKGDGLGLHERHAKNRQGEQAKKVKLQPKDQMDITQHNGDGKQKKQPKMDKKKKHEEEEVYTITMSEQKKAKQAFRKHNELVANNGDDDRDKDKNETPKHSKKKNDKSASEGKGEKKKKLKRRVSFDNHNQARSWKASMNGLRTFDPTETASKAPEKSILLNKGKKSPINKSNTKRGRKRAVDYF